MRTASELRAELTRRAAEDANVRRRLLDDPKGAIEAVLGVHIPDGMAVRVHEEDAHTAIWCCRRPRCWTWRPSKRAPAGSTAHRRS